MVKWSNESNGQMSQIAGGRRSGVQPITTVRLKVRCTTDEFVFFAKSETASSTRVAHTWHGEY